jgi:hypothetical protein
MFVPLEWMEKGLLLRATASEIVCEGSAIIYLVSITWQLLRSLLFGQIYVLKPESLEDHADIRTLGCRHPRHDMRLAGNTATSIGVRSILPHRQV